MMEKDNEKEMKSYQFTSKITDSRISIKNAGREILSTISKSSKNTPNINKNLKVLSPSRDIFSNNSLLIRDKINNTPGYGLWCINISENKNYDKSQVTDMINAGIKNFSESEFKNELEHKIIQTLKIQVSDLISKLEKAVGDFHDANVKALRAEELKESYHKVAEEKVKEYKEASKIAENLQMENITLKEALNNSTKEIVRLNTELRSEREKYSNLSVSFEIYAKEKENTMLSLTNQVKNLGEKVEMVTIERNNLMSMRKASKVSTDNESEFPKYKLKEEYKEIHRSFTPKNETNELILKYQLEIVDLKNKICDHEIQKNKMLDVIKSKNFKIKTLKSEIEKWLNLFGECSKDIKWNQELVNKKKNIIKILKDELNSKYDEEKILLREINKLKNNKPQTNEVGVQKDDDLVIINANPKFFF